MSIFILPSDMVLLSIEVLIALAIGAGIGAAHYFFLWRNVEMLVSGGSFTRALLLHLGRFLATSAALYLMARFGALPLSAALLGIIGARRMMVRRIGTSQ